MNGNSAKTSRVRPLTWITDLNDLVLLHPRLLHGGLDGPDLEDAEEVRYEAHDVLSDGLVHVDHVLDGQVAVVEGERVGAEALQQLDVVQ